MTQHRARYQPKGAHGTQGPHLHVEPYGFGAAPGFQVASSSTPKAQADDGRPRSVTIAMPAPSARSLASARDELARLRADAMQGHAPAQLELGRAYAFGYIVPRDFNEAQSWLAAAADHPDADPETRAAAASGLEMVMALLEAERAQQPARYAKLKSGAADR